jgi:hypothetical protein
MTKSANRKFKREHKQKNYEQKKPRERYAGTKLDKKN